MAPSADFLQRVARARPMLVRYGLKLSKDAEEANDLAQTVMLRAIERFDCYEESGRLDSWLLNILHNTFVNRLRRVRRDVLTGSIELFDKSDDFSLTATVAPSQDVVEAAEGLRKALGALPPRQASMLLAIAYDGMSYAQAADHFAVPIGTIRSRLSRARRIARQAIDGTGPIRRRKRRRIPEAA